VVGAKPDTSCSLNAIVTHLKITHLELCHYCIQFAILTILYSRVIRVHIDIRYIVDFVQSR
jgi:hypothetical protein